MGKTSFQHGELVLVAEFGAWYDLHMHPIQRQFAERLRRIREERGLTQLALAATCGWSVQKISLYERSARSPSLTDLALLAEALHVSIAELVEAPPDSADPVAQELHELGLLLRAQPLALVRTVLRMARALVVESA